MGLQLGISPLFNDDDLRQILDIRDKDFAPIYTLTVGGVVPSEGGRDLVALRKLSLPLIATSISPIIVSFADVAIAGRASDGALEAIASGL